MQKITRPYEVLVRINVDGSMPAHVRRIEEIIDGGVVLFAKELPPEPLDLADPEQFGPLVAALNTALLAENRALLSEIAAMRAAE